MWGITRYQWLVLLAAWLGWGFDVFDALLFNYVAPNCIPALLHLPVGSPEARIATQHWTGVITSLLLLGWAVGGVLFGMISDRFGRMRTLMFTMLLFAVGTAACALATNLWMLAIFRVVASLGIGGEWAAGAAMVAEVMPERRRVEGGALLYTAAPFGLFLATFVNYLVAGVWFANQTEQSWRYVFLFGLLPAAAAFLVRLFVQEPERWKSLQVHSRVRVREIFAPALRRFTYSGMFTAVVALISWWSCSAFIPVIATGLARTSAERSGLGAAATQGLIEHWKVIGTMAFNIGGPAVALLTTFGLDMPAQTRLAMFFVIGVPVFGIFGSFPYYLPELFPTRVRATGAGFCYNIGRVLASVGPFLVGAAAAHNTAMQSIFYVGFVPLVALLFVPWIIETRGHPLSD
jgi:MFS family permease